MIKEWSDSAWDAYLYWQKQDKKVLRKINELVKDIERNGVDKGTGQPEALKYNWAGYWSRRIDKENRLIYTINKVGHLCIAACKGHYD